MNFTYYTPVVKIILILLIIEIVLHFLEILVDFKIINI